MSNQIFLLKIALCGVFVFFLTQTPLAAQKQEGNAPKPEAISKEHLPKLDKAVMGGGAYGAGTVVDFSKKKEEPPLSEVDVLNRSEADGKMSRTERSLLERARRQPQER